MTPCLMSNDPGGENVQGEAPDAQAVVVQSIGNTDDGSDSEIVDTE